MSLSILILSFLSVQISLSEQSENKADVISINKFVVKGTSTLHNWEVDANEVHVDLSVKAEWFDSMNNWNGTDVEVLRVVVPVKGMDGGRGKMNSDLRTALNEEYYPDIIFNWNSLEIEKTDEGPERIMKIHGSLEIAGSNRELQFFSVALLNDKGQMVVRGEVEIDMEDYGIDPPRAFFGAIKTDKWITLEFDLLLEMDLEVN